MTTFRQRLRQGDLLLGQMVLELFTPGIGHDARIVRARFRDLRYGARPL